MSLPFLTHYRVLDVAKDAPREAIKKAYLELAKKWHPDKHEDGVPRRNAEAKMKLVNEAWSVLSDEKRRAEYDALLRRFGRAGPAEYAQKKYEEHHGIWSDEPNGRAKPSPPSKYRSSYGSKEVDFVHVDGPRAVHHGRPHRQKNQESRTVGKRSVVVMGKQDVKVREPRKGRR